METCREIWGSRDCFLYIPPDGHHGKQVAEEGKPRILYYQIQIVAPPEGRLDIPKLTVRYNSSSGSPKIAFYKLSSLTVVHTVSGLKKKILNTPIRIIVRIGAVLMLLQE